MKFQKYQHIERYGTDEVENIEVGKCYIFPKIDGTNSSCWLDNGELKCGSRTRELSLDKDNAGFFEAMQKDERILAYLKAHPTHRLYGEWLVPHTIKTYRDDAWRKFYIFDVAIDNSDSIRGHEYIPYEIYQPLLEEYNLEYLAPLRIVNNGDLDYFTHCLDINTYLVKDGEGAGEGVVIKNYDYYNKYGRQTWAKIVRSEFKERHYKTMGAPESDQNPVEKQIADKYVTEALVEKEFEKIKNEYGWNSKLIPRLLNTVYHELVNEEAWNFVKEYKNPTINFKTLKAFTFNRVKTIKKELFL